MSTSTTSDSSGIDSLLTLLSGIPSVVQAFFYGGYVILFCQCMHIFRKRRLRSRSHKVFLIGTILLFAMCTCQAILYSIPVKVLEMGNPDALFAVNISINALYLLANFVADFLFIYRCYVIWGSNKYKKYILWVPLSLTFVNTGLGGYTLMGFGYFASYGRTLIPAFLCIPLTLAMNVGLCALSAGHIWWISRQLKVLGPQVSQKYNTVIILIIESGAIYCISIIGYLVSLLKGIPASESNISESSSTPAQFFELIFFGIQVVGIVPTLIVVRIGLGVSAEDAQTTILMSRMQFDRDTEETSAGRTINRLSIYDAVRAGGKDERIELKEGVESDL